MRGYGAKAGVVKSALRVARSSKEAKGLRLRIKAKSCCAQQEYILFWPMPGHML